MSRTSKGYQFTISGSSVTAVYEVKNGRTELERMERDETWTFDGSRVIKTEMDDGRLETTVYTDSDGDGLWSEIAEGEARDAFVTAEGRIDLVGLLDAGLLQPADLLVA